VKKVLPIFFCVCLIISLFFYALLPAVAQDITLVPSLEIRGEYDDNVLFTRTNEIDDYLTTIGPALTLDYATELLNLESKIAVGFLRYADEKDLNTENQRYVLNGGYRFTERWNLNGNFSYIKDKTLESELEETGLVNVREDRHRYNAGGGLSYQVSELSDMNINYIHTKTDYDFVGNVDYDYDAVTLSYNRRLKSERDIITVQPSYSSRDSEVSEADDYGLSFGWSHSFSETLQLRAFLGARYTEVRFGDERQDYENWGGTADISLRKTGEVSSTLIGYRRDLRTSAYGEAIEVDRIYCDLRRRVIGRLGIGFRGNLYFTRSEGNFDGEDSRYFEVIPSLNYQITENHTLELAYVYSREEDRNLAEDRERERNRVWIALNFTFPRKW